ncbi:hypothetical protein MIR68_008780 [Amoeboaphelidium protococcarum]|nr:hypothetical protein MIR68_008780 [Amoeboaphelidium protococcarum]
MTQEVEFVEKTFIAPVNIAVVKYWGKRDTELILPTNSSLSLTLDTDDLHSKTTVRVYSPQGGSQQSSDSSDDVEFWLNGVKEPLSTRMIKIVSQLRLQRAQLEQEQMDTTTTTTASKCLPLSQWPLRIVSENNFPTAAGLASSASGLACFVVTLASVYGLNDLSDESLTQLSRLARQGSGSACRSLFGGYVKWEMGAADSGHDSVAVQVASKQHWPEMRAFILVVNDAKKDVSSTAGMQQTVQTSPLFQHRVREVVSGRMEQMERAIFAKDFATFAHLTMQDSNSFHAVCMDTYPPIFYLNDTSKQVIAWVHKFNQAAGRMVLAYTFDAGPNAVLYFLDQDYDLVLSALSTLFDLSLLEQGSRPDHCLIMKELPQSSLSILQQLRTVHPILLDIGSIKRVISTRVGDGPREVLEPLSL